MWSLDGDAVLLLLFVFTVVFIALLLLFQAYMVCFLKRAAAQGRLPTSGPLLSARDAAVAASTAGNAGPDLGVEDPTWALLPGVSCGTGGDEEAGDCVVCLSALGDGGGGGVRVLPRCRHAFHAGCIGRWLGLSHSVCCPICRTPVRPDPAASAAAATSPPLPPLMAAAVRTDEEAAVGVGGAMGGYQAARGVMLFGDHQITDQLHLHLLHLY